MMSDKNIERNTLILWSGGCDSTLTLATEMMDTSRNSPILALSVVSDALNANKISHEKQARLRLEKELKKRFKRPLFTGEINVSFASMPDSMKKPKNSGYHQAALWIVSALTFAQNNTDIVFGFIRGDDFWFYGRQLLEPIIKNAADLTSKSDIKVRYPIMQFEKSEVLGSLKELGLYDLCWWCETPKQSGETCGSCRPCITHNKAIIIKTALSAIPGSLNNDLEKFGQHI